MKHHIYVEALPKDLPHDIQIDISKIEEAIKQYDYLLSRDKNYILANYNLGAITLELKNDPKTAINYFSCGNYTK